MEKKAVLISTYNKLQKEADKLTEKINNLDDAEVNDVELNLLKAQRQAMLLYISIIKARINL